MAGFADLHLHTTHSDGIRSVEELVRLAATVGLSTIAISDHDNIAAFAEAEPIARSLGILLIPAVELSITWNGADVHLLAYSFDPDDAPLSAKLERCRRTRSSRGAMMVERLRDLGIPIEIARVREVCGEGALGRPHIARCLVEIGATSSIEEGFDRYLSEGKPAWVEKERIELEEAIALVHAAGGLTSLAHPTLYADPERLLQTIIPLGLDGIEVHHPDVDAASRDRYLAIVHEKGLIATGGSDDHGFEGADTIGTVMVPVETIRPISDRWKHRNR